MIKSINDIKEIAYSEQNVPETEMLAIIAFDKYRIRYLRDSISDEDFNNRYMELRVMANNISFEEFLKNRYYK